MHRENKLAPRAGRRNRWAFVPCLPLLGLALLKLHPVAAAAEDKSGPPESVPVAVAKVQRENLFQIQTLDGEFRPYQEIDLHAKVAGYVRKIVVDIGDRVKSGQAIAELEVPELDVDLEAAVAAEKLAAEEVKHAQADQQRAEAAFEDAHLAYLRLTAAEKAQPKLIAQQDLDVARTRDKAVQAQMNMAKVAVSSAQLKVIEAQVNVKKLNTLLLYTHITAPFDGVVTKRYADEGSLIQAGTSSSTQTMPLVRFSENGRLRLVFHANESFAGSIQAGQAVEFTIQALNQTFTGTVARTARKIDTATRTMDAEIDVLNPTLALIPGMYASVQVKLNPRNQVIAVPVEAVSRQKKSTVYVVNVKNEIEERTVTLGIETPTKIEVTSGLAENDLVLVGSRTEVHPGQKVEPKRVDLVTAP